MDQTLKHGSINLKRTFKYILSDRSMKKGALSHTWKAMKEGKPSPSSQENEWMAKQISFLGNLFHLWDIVFPPKRKSFPIRVIFSFSISFSNDKEETKIKEFEESIKGESRSYLSKFTNQDQIFPKKYIQHVGEIKGDHGQSFLSYAWPNISTIFSFNINHGQPSFSLFHSKSSPNQVVSSRGGRIHIN